MVRTRSNVFAPVPPPRPPAPKLPSQYEATAVPPPRPPPPKLPSNLDDLPPPLTQDTTPIIRKRQEPPKPVKAQELPLPRAQENAPPAKPRRAQEVVKPPETVAPSPRVHESSYPPKAEVRVVAEKGREFVKEQEILCTTLNIF